MGKPYIERRYRARGPVSTTLKPTRVSGKRRLISAAITWSLTALLFFFLQYYNARPTGIRRRPTLVPSHTTADTVAIAMMVLGIAYLVGGWFYLIWRARRPETIHILRWHFDERGIYSDSDGREDFSPWEWISNVTPTQRDNGWVIDRGILGRRLIPDSAFDNAAEREAFLDTFKRRGIAAAAEVPIAGNRGFEV